MKGHVRRRGRGWSFVIDVSRDPKTGKRRQRWRSGFATRKEAERELRRALGRLDVGDDPLPDKITLEAFAERWLAHMAVQDHPRPRGRAEYERHVRGYVLPMIGGLELRKIRPAHCQAVLDAYSEGRAPRSVAQLRAAMSSLFTTALRWTLVTANPVRAKLSRSPPSAIAM